MCDSTLKLIENDLDQFEGGGPSFITLTECRTVIGRGSAQYPVDFVIFARKNGKDIISRQHCEIVRMDYGIFELKDVGAMNGLFVNGVRITSHVLRHGDIVQFGGIANVPVGTALKTSDVSIKYEFIVMNKRKRMLSTSMASIQRLPQSSASKRLGDCIVPSSSINTTETCKISSHKQNSTSANTSAMSTTTITEKAHCMSREVAGLLSSSEAYFDAAPSIANYNIPIRTQSKHNTLARSVCTETSRIGQIDIFGSTTHSQTLRLHAPSVSQPQPTTTLGLPKPQSSISVETSNMESKRDPSNIMKLSSEADRRAKENADLLTAMHQGEENEGRLRTEIVRLQQQVSTLQKALLSKQRTDRSREEAVALAAQQLEQQQAVFADDRQQYETMQLQLDREWKEVKHLQRDVEVRMRETELREERLCSRELMLVEREKSLEANGEAERSRRKQLEDQQSNITRSEAALARRESELTLLRNEFEEWRRSQTLKLEETRRARSFASAEILPIHSHAVPASSFSTSSSAAGGCVVDTSNLTDALQCAVCELTLLDASVLRCSHAFCRVCCESHWRSPDITSICPVCNDGQWQRWKHQAHSLHPPSSGGVGSGLCVRSEHLDSLVWLLVQSRGEAARKEFKQREKNSRSVLLAMGVDPDLNPWVVELQGDSLNSTSQKDSLDSQYLNNSSSGLRIAQNEAGKKERSPPRCEYCGMSDHGHDECPYDDVRERRDVGESEIERSNSPEL